MKKKKNVYLDGDLRPRNNTLPVDFSSITQCMAYTYQSSHQLFFYLGKFAAGMSEPVGLVTLVWTVTKVIIRLPSRPNGFSNELSESKIASSPRAFSPSRTAAQYWNPLSYPAN